MLATALFMLPAGAWGDRKDNGKLFKLGGVLIFTLASVVCYTAPSGNWLIAGRFLQGGWALHLPAPPDRLYWWRHSQLKKRGTGPRYLGSIGLRRACIRTAYRGGILTLHTGWRSLFLISVILGVITIFISFIFLKSESNRAATTKKADRKGTFLFMTGLTALVYGSSRFPPWQGGGD